MLVVGVCIYGYSHSDPLLVSGMAVHDLVSEIPQLSCCMIRPNA